MTELIHLQTITGYNLIKFSLFLLCFLIELYLLCWNGNQIVENVNFNWKLNVCEWSEDAELCSLH